VADPEKARHCERPAEVATARAMPDEKLIPFEVEVNVNKVRVRVTLMLKARPTVEPQVEVHVEAEKNPKEDKPTIGEGGRA
jgi:hypothetical protein